MVSSRGNSQQDAPYPSWTRTGWMRCPSMPYPSRIRNPSSPRHHGTHRETVFPRSIFGGRLPLMPRYRHARCKNFPQPGVAVRVVLGLDNWEFRNWFVKMSPPTVLRFQSQRFWLISVKGKPLRYSNTPSAWSVECRVGVYLRLQVPMANLPLVQNRKPRKDLCRNDLNLHLRIFGIFGDVFIQIAVGNILHRNVDWTWIFKPTEELYEKIWMLPTRQYCVS